MSLRSLEDRTSPAALAAAAAEEAWPAAAAAAAAADPAPGVPAWGGNDLCQQVMTKPQCIRSAMRKPETHSLRSEQDHVGPCNHLLQTLVPE